MVGRARLFSMSIALLAGCAAQHPTPSGVPALVGFTVNDAHGGEITHTELWVDRRLLAEGETGLLMPMTPLALDREHLVEVRVLLHAPADEAGNRVVWSVEQTFRLTTMDEKGAAGPIAVALTSRPGTSPLARRLDALFSGPGITFGPGSAPRTVSVLTDEDANMALTQPVKSAHGLDAVGDAAERIRAERDNVGVTAAQTDVARTEKDVVKLTCLDGKLTDMREKVRQMEVELEALRAARAADDDTAVRQHHYQIVALARACSGVAFAANQCTGYQGGFD